MVSCDIKNAVNSHLMSFIKLVKVYDKSQLKTNSSGQEKDTNLALARLTRSIPVQPNPFTVEKNYILTPIVSKYYILTVKICVLNTWIKGLLRVIKE